MSEVWHVICIINITDSESEHKKVKIVNEERKVRYDFESINILGKKSSQSLDS